MSPQQGDSVGTIRLQLGDGRQIPFRLRPETWQFYYGGARRDEASKRLERDAERTERSELAKLIASQTDPVGPRQAPETAEDGEVYRLGAALYVGMQEAREVGADEWEVAERAVEAYPAVLIHAGTDAFQAADRMSFVEGVLRQHHPDFDGRSRGERIELLRLGARRMDEAWRAVNAFSEFVQGGRVEGRPKRKIPDPQPDLRAAELKDALDLSHREIGEILRVPLTETDVHQGGQGRIENPGLAKLEAIAGAMGFPPQLWFGAAGGTERVLDEALVAALKDDTVAAILEQVMALSVMDRRLLLGIAREISGPGRDR